MAIIQPFKALRPQPQLAKQVASQPYDVLSSTEAKKEGRPASRYTTTKNKQNHPERLELKKYNPFLRRHTIHRETR